MLWQPAAEPGVLPEEAVRAVLPMEDGFLAAIADGWSGPAQVFESAEGSRWTAVLVDPAADAWVNDIAAAGGRLVAVGGREERAGGVARLVDLCEREPPGANGAAWWSDDGVTWRPAGSRRLWRGFPVQRVVGHGTGFVAVGGWNTGDRGESMAWVSPDGRSWSRAADTRALAAGSMDDLAVLGGLLVAVGGSECRVEAPVAWRSSDGMDWDAAPIGRDGRATVVAGGPAGFLAAGWSAEGDAPVTDCSGDPCRPPAAWLSTDGLAWEPAALPDGTGGVRDLVGLPDGYLLVTDDGAIWSSRDGRSWSSAMVTTPGVPARVAVGHDVAVAMGRQWSDEGAILVWTALASALP
jgi:hypothetical protein